MSPILPGATYERVAKRLAGALAGASLETTQAPAKAKASAPAPAAAVVAAAADRDDSVEPEREDAPEPDDAPEDTQELTEPRPAAQEAACEPMQGAPQAPAAPQATPEGRGGDALEAVGAAESVPGVDVSCLVVPIPATGRGPAWVRTTGADTRLGQWASMRPHGLWWDGGLWTDRYVLPASEPVAAGARTMSSPALASARWTQVRGQRHGKLAWIIALDAGGAVLCQWVLTPAQAASLLSDLVAPGYPWPGDSEWYLDRAATPTMTHPADLEPVTSDQLQDHYLAPEPPQDDATGELGEAEVYIDEW